MLLVIVPVVLKGTPPSVGHWSDVTLISGVSALFFVMARGTQGRADVVRKHLVGEVTANSVRDSKKRDNLLIEIARKLMDLL